MFIGIAIFIAVVVLIWLAIVGILFWLGTRKPEPDPEWEQWRAEAIGSWNLQGCGRPIDRLDQLMDTDPEIYEYWKAKHEEESV